MKKRQQKREEKFATENFDLAKHEKSPQKTRHWLIRYKISQVQSRFNPLEKCFDARHSAQDVIKRDTLHTI